LTVDKLLLFLAVLILGIGIGGFYYFSEQATLLRAGMVVSAAIVALVVALQSQSGRAAWEFAKTARQELRKVIWPTRRETIQTTLLVVALVIAIGLYIWLLDTGLSWAVKALVLG